VECAEESESALHRFSQQHDLRVEAISEEQHQWEVSPNEGLALDDIGMHDSQTMECTHEKCAVDCLSVPSPAHTAAGISPTETGHVNHRSGREKLRQWCGKMKDAWPPNSQPSAFGGGPYSIPLSSTQSLGSGIAVRNIHPQMVSASGAYYVNRAQWPSDLRQTKVSTVAMTGELAHLGRPKALSRAGPSKGAANEGRPGSCRGSSAPVRRHRRTQATEFPGYLSSGSNSSFSLQSDGSARPSVSSASSWNGSFMERRLSAASGYLPLTQDASSPSFSGRSASKKDPQGFLCDCCEQRKMFTTLEELKNMYAHRK